MSKHQSHFCYGRIYYRHINHAAERGVAYDSAGLQGGGACLSHILHWGFRRAGAPDIHSGGYRNSDDSGDWIFLFVQVVERWRLCEGCGCKNAEVSVGYCARYAAYELIHKAQAGLRKKFRGPACRACIFCVNKSSAIFEQARILAKYTIIRQKSALKHAV